MSTVSENKKETMKKIFEEQPVEVQKIVQEVIDLETKHLHEARPRLTEEIERIVVNFIKK
ncbi:hypothetical protein [Paenibacillus oleatilyticus]|uniref:hypothetical protein n=1 Tax=Paenibacillus oleatilyticus TaxID=2594886 RepID=UPI001C1F2469|nr:hypothetical protein [Paenibacillus oleatilyticus]MBU7315378.1 hypothetical protein [Paenibacillus oleatilyticus]